ncbi:MAG: DNA polymerase III subunit beta [Lachnospiraceae bacterium]|nr:DNA polymerase III subunit beta [Lachnospiraceae bacterium]
MKIECSKSAFVNGVNIVSKAVPSKTTMSILQCILIKAKDDVITLTANDMELGIETKIEGKILEEGSVAIDAKFFSEAVRKLPDDVITIDVDEKFNAKITCQKSKLDFSCKDGEEFTALPKINKTDNVLISDYSLKEIIRQTIFCVGDSSSNAIMNSELFHINDDKFEVVALDGHRIAYRKIELKNKYSEKKVIVPGKTLGEIERILSGDQNKDVLIYFEKNHILFELEGTIIVSRLVEGNYFDYEKMLTKDYETKIVANKKEIFSSIDRSTLMLREGEKKPIIFEVRDGSINFTIKTMFGEMNEDINVDKSGKDIDIAFNPQFFLDTLKVLEDDEITIYMMSPKNPCIIRNEDDSYVYLILPVNFVR